MDSPFIINIQNPGRYYALFYFLAFLIGLILLIREGQKRRFPTVPWLLVITTAFLFFMVGTQAVKFTAKDWSQVFRFEQLDYFPGRSVLGGVLLVVPGLLLAKYALRFRYSMMDTFAWVTPVGMVIQRAGCLLAGCCYGTVTSLPWGIKYGVASHAFQQHTHENLIPMSSNLSLAVHPVQLYDMIGCTLSLLVLSRLKKYIKASGNLFLTSILLYGLVRFVIEFFRNSSLGNSQTFGLTVVQGSILLLAPVLASIIFFRERRIQHSTAVEKVQSQVGQHYIFYFAFISFLFFLFSRWLSPLEVVTLNLVLFPTLFLIGWQVFKAVTVPQMRWVTASLIAGSLVMMSQTLPEKSKNDSTKISYNIFSIGTMSGSSQFTIGTDQSCINSNITLNNEYSANAIGFSRVVQQSRDKTIQFGIDGYSGRHREDANGIGNNNISTIGIHPYFQYDTKHIGLGAGFHAGSLTELMADATNSLTSVHKMSFYPSFYFRAGDIDRFFVEGKVAKQFPTCFPALAYQANLGFGFGRTNGSAFRIGTASYAGLFVAVTFPAGKHLRIEPYTGLLGGLIGHGYDKESNLIAALSLRYKFNIKERPLK